MRFLVDEWLCDVATDYKGKCLLVAILATIVERSILPERPGFFISAGQRGGGKTTAVNMISIAALGVRAAAAAWSPSEEERRKALLAYLSEGTALIAWDNIPRGAAISCPSIEKALTAETYADRVLGKSENRSVPATAIQIFNGNNISPKGDLASRVPLVRLSVDRPDPENRQFKHSDPLAWTEANRGRILQAIYTILLGNPRLRDPAPPPAETRFKVWYHVVGSAIENAARLHAAHDFEAEEIRFREIFLESEVDEEQSDSLATVLTILYEKWPNGFKASDVYVYLVEPFEDNASELREAIEQASGKASIRVLSAKVVNWRLKSLIDAPIEVDGKLLALRYKPDRGGHGGTFCLEQINQR